MDLFHSFQGHNFIKDGSYSSIQLAGIGREMMGLNLDPRPQFRRSHFLAH